jgi:hypothetical protein
MKRSDVKAALAAAGRWQEAVRFRDQLKEQGLAPADAYAKMVEKFLTQPPDTPPVVTAPTAEPQPDAPAPKRRRRRRKRQSFDWKRNAEWVFLNMEEDGDDGQAPSSGAKAMLRWAKANPADFFRLLPRVLPSRAEQEAKDKKRQEEDEQKAAGKAQLDNWAKNWQEQHEQEQKEREREQRAAIRSWTLDECLRRLQEAAAGNEPDDYSVFARKAEEARPLPIMPAEPNTPLPPVSPPLLLPKSLQVCPFCEKERLAGRKPDPRCACCAYIRHYQIEAPPPPPPAIPNFAQW